MSKMSGVASRKFIDYPFLTQVYGSLDLGGKVEEEKR